jgi:hypothetical protein
MKNTLTLQEALQYLGAINPSGNDTKSLPAVGRYRVRSMTKYVAATSVQITSNQGKVILPNTLKAIGTTNFDNGNILPAGKSFLVTAIRVLSDTTVGKTTATAVYDNVAPVDFKNGEFRVSQNGQGVCFESSGSDVANFKASTGNDADFREVTPFLLRSNANFDVEIAFNGAATACVYKVEFRGQELIAGDQA